MNTEYRTVETVEGINPQKLAVALPISKTASFEELFKRVTAAAQRELERNGYEGATVVLDAVDRYEEYTLSVAGEGETELPEDMVLYRFEFTVTA